jgi:prepilin-type N-terminal cleavage/methylation domain-containing protein
MTKGFTLVELIITLGISFAALAGLVNMFFIFNATHEYQRIFHATAGSASASMNAIEAAVLPARHVLSSRTISGTTYSSGPSTLVLEVPAVDDIGNMVNGTNDYIVIVASSTSLYRITDAAATSARESGTTLLSTTLNALSFTYDEASYADVSRVTADVHTRATYKNDTAQTRLIEELRLRNFEP